MHMECATPSEAGDDDAAADATDVITDQALSAYLQDIEDNLKRGGVNLEEQVARVEQLLQLLQQQRLTGEQAGHVARVSLPKFVLAFLKVRLVDLPMQRLNQFFQSVLDTVVFMLRNSEAWEIIESASRILTDGSNYQCYTLPANAQPAAREADSPSSADGSASDASATAADSAEDDGSILRPCRAEDDVSPHYRRHVQYFAQIGGFQSILELLSRKPLLSLTAVRVLLRPYLKVKDVLKLNTLQKYVREVHSVMVDYLRSLSDEQLKQEDRKSISELHTTLDALLHAARLPEALASLDQLHLALALKCLKTPNLEKRLYGLNDIKEMINLSLRKQEYLEGLGRTEREHKGRPAQGAASSVQESGHCSADRLVEWLQREQVVDFIFGEGLHDQIVKRCVEVLCFLAMRNALDASTLERIWRSSLDKHESVKQAIYLVLVDLTGHLSLPLLDALYSLIRSVPLSEYSLHTLSLLRGFAISAIQSPVNSPRDKRWFGLEELWQLMQQHSPVSPELRAAAGEVLAELLTWQHCAPQRAPMLQRCISQLEEGSSVPQTLRLCCKVLSSFPCKPRKKGESVSQLLGWLAEGCRLLPAFFDDLTRYHDEATSRLAAMNAAVAEAAHTTRETSSLLSLRALRISHMQQIQERLDFLSFCLVNAPLRLERRQLDVLWECCVVRRSCDAEADLLFHWIEQARMSSSHALDVESTRHLFSRASALPLGGLSPTGYSCIEYLFRWLNWREGRFIEHDAHGVTVLALPLYGVETLWEVALIARHEVVGRRVVAFLTSLHHSLSPQLHALHTQQRRQFVGSCMASLSEVATQLFALEERQRRGGISASARDQSLLASSAQGAEVAPPPAPPSLAGMPGSPPVALDDSTDEEDECEVLKLRVERCLTLLRLFVEEVERKWPRMNGSSCATRHGSVSRGVPMRVAVMLVGATDSPRPLVLVHSNQTVGDLRHRIWQELDKVLDGESPAMLRLISGGRELKEDWQTLGELKLREPYAVHVMRRPQHCKPQLESVARAPDATVDPSVVDASRECGRGSEGGSAASGEAAPSTSTADLERAIREELEASMPAQLLSEVGSNFKTLFELLSLQDERLSGRAWQLLMMLPTNAAMRSALAELPSLPADATPDWRALLHEGGSACKLLYSLQITDALVQDEEALSRTHCAPNRDGSSGGTPWSEALIARGGLRHLLGLLTSPAALLAPARGSRRKQCLLLLLRLVSNFVLAELRDPAKLTVSMTLAGQQQPPFAASASAAAADAVADAAAAVPAPAAETGLWLLWAQRSFASLRSPESAEHTVGLESPLIELLELLASEAPRDGGDAAADSDTEELDVQIAREALRLLVACMRARVDAFYAMCFEQRLVPWLHAVVLRAPNAELRREVCFALFSFASDGTAATADETSAGESAITTLLIDALLRLLPPGEYAQRSQQYFELVQALLATGACELPTPALQQCEQLVDLLQRHQPLERRDRPELVDQQLLGYLRLLLTLARAHPAVRRPLGEAGLVQSLFDALFLLRSADDARRLGPSAPPSCKSQECRTVAYALLVELADGVPANLALLVELQLVQQRKRSAVYAAGMQWHYMPAAQEKSPCGYVGLKNLGATCYFNSLAQQLFMIPEFRTAVLDLPIALPKPLAAAESGAGAGAATSGSAPNVNLLYHLQVMFGYLQESEKRSFDTKEFCGAYRDFENLPMNPSVQMDVDEFLTHLFDQLENALRDTPQSKLLQSLFGGNLVNQIVSKEGRKLSERLEPFYVIPIEVKMKNSVLDGLSQFVEGEVLDGDNKYKCEDTQEYVEAVKRCCVHKLPPVLILHLKRFEFDYDLMKKMKVNDHCEFPPTIDMRPYSVDWLEQQERAAALGADADGSLPAADDDVGDGANGADANAASAEWLYHLVGVLVHTGTADSGHYYSFIKERRCFRRAAGEGCPASDWLHFNDTLVEWFDEREIGKCCFGGVEPFVSWDSEGNKQIHRTQVRQNSAYMLFYERAAAAAPQPAPQGPAAAESPLHEATPLEYGTDALRGGGKLFSVPVPVNVPQHILNKVWEENMQFMRDRYVFDPLHFECLHRIVSLALEQGLPQHQQHQQNQGDPTAQSETLEQLSNAGGPLAMLALQLGCRFFVETLARARDKSMLPEWLAMLQAGLLSYMPACRWLLLQSEQAGWLKQLLLQCTIPEMRSAFAQLLLHTMRCLRRVELHLYAADAADNGGREDDEDAPGGLLTADERNILPVLPTDVTGDSATGSHTTACVSDWESDDEVEEDDTASRPLQYQRSEAAPADAAQAQLAPLADRVSPAANLRVVSALLAMLHEAQGHWRHFSQFFELLLDFARLGSEERRWLLGRRVISQLVDFYLGDDSPLATGDGNGAYRRAKRVRMGDKFTLPNLEHMVSLISLLARSAARPEDPATTAFSLPPPMLTIDPDEYSLLMNQTLLRKLLRDGLNVPALAALVRHCSFGVQERSAPVLHCILQGIDSMDAEALGPYLHLFCAYVTIFDEHREWRTQYAMGRLLRVIASNLRYKHATVACLRMLIELSGHDRTRRWLLQHQSSWLREWLLGGHSDAVRCTTERLCYKLIEREAAEAEAAPAAQLAGSEAPNTEAAGPPTPPSCAATEAAPSAADSSMAAPPSESGEHGIGSTFEQLISMLPAVTSISHESAPGSKNLVESPPPPRFAPYFRLCAWCARRGAVSRVLDVPMMVAVYSAQDQQRLECDEVKKEMVTFWLAATRAALDAKPPYFPSDDGSASDLPPVLARPSPSCLHAAFKRLLDSFVSLRPNETFLLYNRASLPAFYGLLVCLVAMDEDGGCLDMLQAHRNWEWAVKYLVIESQDYVQLLRFSSDAELGPLGSSLSSMLRATCKRHAPFRKRVLNAALSADKLPGNATNVLPLLSMCIVRPDEESLACELGALQQLCTCFDAAGSVLPLDERHMTYFQLVLDLFARCFNGLPAVQQKVLSAWDVATTTHSLLTTLFILLSASLRLGAERPRPTATPPHEVQELCYKISIALAALNLQCATLIIQTLLNNHRRLPHPLSTAQPDLDPPEAADVAHAAPPPSSPPGTLASLPIDAARRAATRAPERLGMYYAFATSVLGGALSSHGAHAVFVGPALRLALCLATEAALLPSALPPLARIVVQALALSEQTKAATSEDVALAVGLLRRLVVEEPAALRSSQDARECCRKLLRVSPLAAQSLRVELEARLPLSPLAGSPHSGVPDAPPSAVVEPQALRNSVRLLLRPEDGTSVDPLDEGWRHELSEWWTATGSP